MLLLTEQMIFMEQRRFFLEIKIWLEVKSMEKKNS
jgi:hypothetical protein